jgi:hypothetical protein
VLKPKHVKQLVKAKFAFRSSYASDVMKTLKERFVNDADKEEL